MCVAGAAGHHAGAVLFLLLAKFLPCSLELKRVIVLQVLQGAMSSAGLW